MLQAIYIYIPKTLVFPKEHKIKKADEIGFFVSFYLGFTL
jgi:hypothetical protein